MPDRQGGRVVKFASNLEVESGRVITGLRLVLFVCGSQDEIEMA